MKITLVNLMVARKNWEIWAGRPGLTQKSQDEAHNTIRALTRRINARLRSEAYQSCGMVRGKDSMGRVIWE